MKDFMRRLVLGNRALELLLVAGSYRGQFVVQIVNRTPVSLKSVFYLSFCVRHAFSLSLRRRCRQAAGRLMYRRRMGERLLLG